MPRREPKKKNLTLAGRPPTEVGVIVAVIACAVVVIAIFLEWLVSEKGLISQRRGGEDDGASE